MKLAQPKHSTSQTSKLPPNLLRCFCPSLLCTSSQWHPLHWSVVSLHTRLCFVKGSLQEPEGAGRAEPESLLHKHLCEPLPCLLLHSWQLLGTPGMCIPSHFQWDLRLAQSPSENRQGDGALGCCCCWRRAAREGGILHRVYKLGEILTY